MNVSIRVPIILLLAISISTGILLYPGPVNGTIYTRTTYIKNVEPDFDPSLRFGEPGEDPSLVLNPAGSSLGADYSNEDLTEVTKDARDLNCIKKEVLSYISSCYYKLKYGLFLW